MLAHVEVNQKRKQCEQLKRRDIDRGRKKFLSSSAIETSFQENITAIE